MTAETTLTLASTFGLDLLNPNPDDYRDFNWIAEHLAKEKRYNGATPDMEYSVAEHMARGAAAIMEATGDETLAAYFLCHDIHEAVLKDDTTPKKRAIAAIAEEKFGVLASHIMDVFRALEYRQDVAIHEAAGLVWPPNSMHQAAIKRWDLIMFVTEWRDVMHAIPHPNWAPYNGINPLPNKIEPAPNWRIARDVYLSMCRRYLPALKAQASGAAA